MGGWLKRWAFMVIVIPLITGGVYFASQKWNPGYDSCFSPWNFIGEMADLTVELTLKYSGIERISAKKAEEAVEIIGEIIKQTD